MISIIYISHSSSCLFYTHMRISFLAFICTFILYAFILIIITSCCLHNVRIHHLAIYSLMNLSYCIWLSYLITIFNICCHYSWDLSYIHMMSIIWYSLLSFTLIHTWHILDVSIWLSFSWSAHFDEVYILKFSTIFIIISKWRWSKIMRSK